MSTTELIITEQHSPQQVADDVYDDGYLRVEHQNYYVSCGGQILKLPKTEFLILSRLARTAEKIVRSEDLWKYARGADKPLNAESLHVYMYRLRNKIADRKLHIDTMVNVGYRLLLTNRAP